MPNSDQDMVYRFFKPGFCEHQSDKLIPAVNRKAILLDKNFACHPKVTLLARKSDPVPLLVLLYIWSRLDLESGSWSMRMDFFEHWVRTTYGKGNRYSVKECLESLRKVQLLDFVIIPITECSENEFID